MNDTPSRHTLALLSTTCQYDRYGLTVWQEGSGRYSIYRSRGDDPTAKIGTYPDWESAYTAFVAALAPTCNICGQVGGRLVSSYCGDGFATARYVHPACARKSEQAGGIVR